MAAGVVKILPLVNAVMQVLSLTIVTKLVLISVGVTALSRLSFSSCIVCVGRFDWLPY